MLHQIKVKDIPFSTKFRDKGTPIDNLGNYDSSGERIIYLCASERIRQKRLLFVTKLGMMKLVDTSEFDVMKKTVASTKLTDGDELIGIYETDARTEVLSKFNYDGTVGEEEVVSSDQNIILQTANGVFLKFPLTDVPQKKKNAVGVRGIKLGSDDYIEDVFNIVDKNAVIGQMVLPFVAIGDGNNDAEMIEAAEVGIGYGGVREIAPAVLACASHAIYDEEKLVEFLERLL